MQKRHSVPGKILSLMLSAVLVLSVCFIGGVPTTEAVETGSTYVPGHYYYYPAGTKFVTGFALSKCNLPHQQNSAKKDLSDNGYTVCDKDLNDGAGAGSKYIFVGYKLESNINSAVTYVRNRHVNDTSSPWTVNGVRYNIVSTQDLNEDAGGDYIYMYYTKDKSAGLPVTAFAVDEDSTKSNYLTALRDNTNEASDVNREAGGDYIYMHFGDYSVYTDVTAAITRLRNLVNTANGLDSSDYTTGSWQKIAADLARANPILAAYEANEWHAATVAPADINAAADTLNTDLNDLQALITIDGNGGTPSDTSYFVKSGLAGTVNFPASRYTATWEGYNFLGWSTDPLASTGALTGDVPVAPGGTVHAIWDIRSYHVLFYNTHTEDYIGENQYVEYGSPATAPDSSEYEQYYTVSGDNAFHYEFTGWDKDFSSVTRSMVVSTVYERRGHAYSVNTTEPTCTRDGSTVYTCTVCGYSYSEKIPTPGHQWSQWVKVDDDTHTRTCSVDNVTETAPHTWVVSTDASTCTEPGTRVYTCSGCGATYSEEVEALGHDYGDWENEGVNAEDGSGSHVRICRNDPAHVIRESHSWNDGYVKVEPTETSTGLTIHTCTVCGARWNEVTPVDSHNWGEWEVVTPVTCTESGMLMATCLDGDGAVKYKVVKATGHSWGDWETTSQPTCTEPGIRTRTCKNGCGEVQTKEMAPKGHSDADGDGYCDVCYVEIAPAFRCAMCPMYEEYRDMPVVGWLVGIVHYFLHMATIITHMASR